MHTRYISFENDVRIRFIGDRLLTNTPYREDWLEAARHLEGKYRKRTRSWSFPANLYPEVVRHLNRCFRLKIPLDMVDLRGVQSQSMPYRDGQSASANDRDED